MSRDLTKVDLRESLVEQSEGGLVLVLASNGQALPVCRIDSSGEDMVLVPWGPYRGGVQGPEESEQLAVLRRIDVNLRELYRLLLKKDEDADGV